MSEKSKFDLIVENALHRFQRTEFLVGDLVTLTDGWDRDEWVKRQSEGTIEHVRNIIDSKHHLRVAGIRGLHNDGYSAMGNSETPDFHYVELVEELSPGRYSNFVTVPVHLVKRVELEGNNVTAPMPDDMVRDSTAHIAPEEVSAELNDDPMGAVKQTGVKDGDKSLPDKNVTLPGATGADSYTGKYLER